MPCTCVPRMGNKHRLTISACRAVPGPHPRIGDRHRQTISACRGGSAASLSANGQQTLTSNFRVLSKQRRRPPAGRGAAVPPPYPRMATHADKQFSRVKRATAKASGGQGMMPCTLLPRMAINFNGQFPRNALGNGYSGDDVRREEVFRQNRARESLLSRPRILTEKPPVFKTGESDAAASDFPPPTAYLLSPSS